MHECKKSANSSSSPVLFSGTAAADFFVDAPLADALPLTEEEEEEEGGGGGKSGDGGGGRATTASASAAPLIAVRFLGPFSASAGVPTTLCWRLERLSSPLPAPPGGASGGEAGEGGEAGGDAPPVSSSSFRFEVRAPRGGGWELPGSSSGEAGEEESEDDDGDDEEGRGGGGEASAAAAVGGTVRLWAAPGSSAVVEASWTPASSIAPLSASSSSSGPSSSPSALSAPALVVFDADGREVGRSGRSVRSAAAGGASDEFVFVGGR